MDWLGIGVFVIAIGFAVVVIFLVPVLKRLEQTLGSTAETIDKTQKNIENISSETTLMLYNANETILDINNKLMKLDPLFQIVNDTGESANHLTSSLLKVTSLTDSKIDNNRETQPNETSSLFDRNKLQGLVRGAAFIYYLLEAKKVIEKRKSNLN
ncbi:DUF948 domain-containing protein [Evansella sp. AB-P1]|uniref:DUF948 domain-containing protein n=1 Tax=Evansella sp. AB-P1 TaxID=3037653 RepID=UPI00241E26F5|nr:DUF948 domain-containing protein [Evansella sp. AB-P1]MDG5785962.1 DUF948 domain-containing protein [Evansella sp. AB-P1]